MQRISLWMLAAAIGAMNAGTRAVADDLLGLYYERLSGAGNSPSIASLGLTWTF